MDTYYWTQKASFKKNIKTTFMSGANLNLLLSQ